MYKVILDPSNCFGTVQAALEDVCKLEITKNSNGGFNVRYKLKYCYWSESTFGYSKEFTEEEVYKDFYKTHVLNLVKNNGYCLFKHLE